MSIRMTRKMNSKQHALKKEIRRMSLLKKLPLEFVSSDIVFRCDISKLINAHKNTKPNPLPGELDESYPGQVSQQEFLKRTLGVS